MARNASLPVQIPDSRPARSSGCVVERLEYRRLFNTVLALDKGKTLIAIDSDNPGDILAKLPIRGLLSKETIAAIDFEPATGNLYGLSSTNRLYQINPSTGRATNALTSGNPLTGAPAGTDFGFDFVPDTSRIRVISGSTLNTLYGAPGGGSITVANKTAPAYGAADANFGITPDIVAIAHNNNVASGDPATLFGVDRANNILVRIGSEGGDPDSPDTGTLTTLAPLGQGPITGAVGFDIITDPATGLNTALVGFSTDPKSRTALSTVDLTTGVLTPLGEIGKAKRPATDLAVVPTGSTIILASARSFQLLDSNMPALPVFTSPRITGLAAKDKLLFIDRRPSTGKIYAYSKQLRLYEIDSATGVAVEVGQTTGVGFDKKAKFTGDIDPVRETMRVVSTLKDNFRISLADASVLDADLVAAGIQLDVDVAYGQGDPNRSAFPAITGIAYTQAIPGATFTVPFGIDQDLDVLTTIASPDGELATTANLFALGALGVDVVQVVGFDIVTTSDGVTNTAFLAYKGKGGYFLTRVDLNSGATTEPLKLGKGPKPIGMTATN